MEDISINRWAVVELAFCDAGLSYEEAGLLHYIAKFEKNKGPVFAGLARISKDTRISERSVQRHIRKLIKLDFLQERTTGRSRYLTANHAKMAAIIDANLAATHAKVASKDAKMAPTHAKLAPDPCQNGMLHIEVPTEVPTEVTYRKKPIASNSSDLATTGLDFYKNLGFVKTGKPPQAKPQRHSESAEEKAAFLQFKKDLLSKTKTSIAEYDDIPD